MRWLLILLLATLPVLANPPADLMPGTYSGTLGPSQSLEVNIGGPQSRTMEWTLNNQGTQVTMTGYYQVTGAADSQRANFTVARLQPESPNLRVGPLLIHQGDVLSLDLHYQGDRLQMTALKGGAPAMTCNLKRQDS